MTLWYTILIGVLSILFGSFIYLNQSREVANDARFRLGKEMEGLIHNMDRGYEVGVREDESFAVLDPEGKVVKKENITDGDIRDIALRFEAEPQIDPEVPPPPARTGAGQRVNGKAFSWVKYYIDAGRIYGEMELRPRSSIDESSPAGMLIFTTPLDPYGLHNKLLLTLFIAVLLMLALAFLSGIWLANRSMKPVAQIAETARSIGEGDLSRRIRLQSSDELGEISDVFDAMLDRLQAAFDRQKRFVADAGHELRTPLSVILLETESALAAKRSAEEYRGSLELVRTEGSYMSRLVEDLLYLARAENSAHSSEKQRIDLADIVVECLERISPMASAKNVRLNCAELPEAPVMGDRAGLIKVVSNLLGNAVKYSRADGGTVAVKLTLEPAGSASLSVSDDGIGIPADKLPHVFERFYRVDESRTEEEGAPSGSGLGLSIVKTIVEAEGGTVSVQSREGAGSAFTVRLPLAPQPAIAG